VGQAGSIASHAARRKSQQGRWNLAKIYAVRGELEITFKQTAYLDSLIAKRDKEASGERGL
jgi:hypothetical protein